MFESNPSLALVRLESELCRVHLSHGYSCVHTIERYLENWSPLEGTPVYAQPNCRDQINAMTALSAAYVCGDAQHTRSREKIYYRTSISSAFMLTLGRTLVELVLMCAQQ